jgi:hypothetical protein
MITRVETNFKTLSGTHTFGQVTLISGPNGSGKTALIQSAQVATTTEVSDVQSRNVKSSGKINEIFNDTDIRVHFDDDSAPAIFKVQNGGQQHRPPLNPVVWLMPEVDKLWSSNSKSIIAKLLSFISIDPEKPWDAISEHLRKSARKLVPKGTPVTEMFTLLHKQTSDAMSDSNKKAKALREEAKTLAGLLANVTVKDVEQLTARKKELSIELETISPIIGGDICPHCNHVTSGSANPEYTRRRTEIARLQTEIETSQNMKATHQHHLDRQAALPQLTLEAEQNASLYQSIKAEAASANARILNEVASSIAKMLNAYLPFQVIIDPNADFCIQKKIILPNGQAKAGPGLSGAEEILVLAALGTLMADPSKDTIILFPDRGWAPDNLSAALNILCASAEKHPRIQYILQATVTPTVEPASTSFKSIYL